MFTKSKFNQILTIIVMLTMLFPAIQPSVASAQSGDGSRRQGTSAQDDDGTKRQVNRQTGRVSFIGPESGRVLPAAQALGTFTRPQDPARALADRFAPEFGIKDPGRELAEIRTSHPEGGRVTVRYQQMYQGIPVMGGELIVNTNERGDLYSMNGEVSPDLSLRTTPTIDSTQAAETALQAMAETYQKTADDFVASAPELWIYDESLLRPSTRPVELVWRMEVTAADHNLPVRELVLVNAQGGSISLHFNQVDTAWTGLNEDVKINKATENIPALAGATWYVATIGNDSNSCSSAGSPCATINGAIGKATAGDTIYVATGTYTGSSSTVVLINKDITLSGGWDASFVSRSGMTTIDGQMTRAGITSSDSPISTVEYFIIQNGYGWPAGIANNGEMSLNHVAVINNKSTDDGGGINNSGTLIINNSTVSNNSSQGSWGGGG